MRLLDGDHLIAEHARSWSRRQVFEKSEHRAVLLEERRAARNLKGRDRIRAVVPAFDRIIERWGVSGTSLGCRVMPIALVLPAHLDDADVIPHDLESYDE